MPLRERLAPLGFNAQHIDVLSGSGILHIAVELAYSAPDTVELELTSTSTVGALKGLLHERSDLRLAILTCKSPRRSMLKWNMALWSAW